MAGSVSKHRAIADCAVKTTSRPHSVGSRLIKLLRHRRRAAKARATMPAHQSVRISPCIGPIIQPASRYALLRLGQRGFFRLDLAVGNLTAGLVTLRRT